MIMDGITIAGIIIGAQIPTWIALSKLYYKVGKLEGAMNQRYSYKHPEHR